MNFSWHQASTVRWPIRQSWCPTYYITVLFSGFQSEHIFPSQVTRGERVSVTFNLRIFHVFRTKYRNTCKIYKKQLDKAYYEYINNLIETPISDQPEKFWRFVKSKRQDNIGINTLEEDNTNASHNYGKAMFLMIISILFFTKEKLNSLPSLDPSLSCPNFNQIIVTSFGVQKLLESLTVNKANGPHGVQTYILRELSHELAPIQASLFQQSLDQGQLPNDWIKANVVPILKKGKRSLASNYRPLSLTSVTSKTL